MNSISCEIGPDEVFAELLMMRQDFDGAMLLLEGSHDADRFEKFVDEEACGITICFGKENLVGAIKIAQEENFDGCIALADADFDRVLGKLQDFPNIVYSENYDFDMDLLKTDATRRYLKVVADNEKCSAFGTHDQLFDAIVMSLAPLTHAKLANELFGLGYSIREVQWYKFYKDFRIDPGRLLAGILGKEVSQKGALDALKARLADAASKVEDVSTITNGHDFCWGLGENLRETIGNRARNLCSGKEVEIHIRLTIDESDFKSLAIFKKIKEWEQKTGYLVLKRHIA